MQNYIQFKRLHKAKIYKVVIEYKNKQNKVDDEISVSENKHKTTN